MNEVGLFVSTDGSGNISTIKEYTNWDFWNAIVPGSFGGASHTDLLFYERFFGEGRFVSIDGSGNISTIKDYKDWDKDWDLIVPGNFGGAGHTDLLLYKRSGGEGLFVSTDGSGNISTIKDNKDWDRTWNMVIPGNYGNSGGFTGLLLYSLTPKHPKSPANLKVTSVAVGKIDVAWTDQSNNEDGFRVRFRGKGEGLGDHIGTTTVDRNSVTASLTDLRNEYEYTISVVAFNSSGESQSSNEVHATTPPGGDGGGSPGSPFITAGLEPSFDPVIKEKLRIRGQGFQPAESVSLRITMKFGDHNPFTESQATTADALGLIDFIFTQVGGLCSPPEVRIITVQATGLSSAKNSNVAQTGC